MRSMVVFFIAFFLCAQGCSSSSGYRTGSTGAEPISAGPITTPPISIETQQAMAEKDTVRSTDKWQAIQRLLQESGYSPGRADGIPGPKTRAAIREYQKSVQLPVTGFVSAVMSQRLFQSNSGKRKNQSKNVASSTARKSKTTNSSSQLSGNDKGPLSVSNLAGEWAPTQIWETNSFPLKQLERNEPNVIYHLEKTGLSRYRTSKIYRHNSDTADGVTLTAKEKKDGFSLTLTSNTEEQGDWFPMHSLDPHYSANGVDILTNVTAPTISENMYLIRFRPDGAANEADIALMNYFEFCSGPARKLASQLSYEIQKLSLTKKAITAKNYPQVALAIGLFGSNKFAEVFGQSFMNLSTASKTTIIERLRVCAIYHVDRQPADLLAQVLFGDSFNREAIKAEIGRSSRWNWPLRSNLNASNVSS